MAYEEAMEDEPMPARSYRPPRHEPPALAVMMEVLRLIAANGTVTVTLTLSSAARSETTPE